MKEYKSVEELIKDITPEDVNEAKDELTEMLINDINNERNNLSDEIVEEQEKTNDLMLENDFDEACEMADDNIFDVDADDDYDLFDAEGDD